MFQRQLASLRERLAAVNHDTSNGVAASINLPNYTSTGVNWAAPRRNVSSSLSAIKGEFQSQREVQQNKLMKALLAVSMKSVCVKERGVDYMSDEIIQRYNNTGICVYMCKGNIMCTLLIVRVYFLDCMMGLLTFICL